MVERSSASNMPSPDGLIRCSNGSIQLLEQPEGVLGRKKISVFSGDQTMFFMLEANGEFIGKVYHDVIPLEMTLRFDETGWKDMYAFYIKSDPDSSLQIPLGFQFSPMGIDAYFLPGRQRDGEQLARLARRTTGSVVSYEKYGIFAERRNGIFDIVADGNRYHFAPNLALEEAMELQRLMNDDLQSRASEIIDMAQRFQHCVTLPRTLWHPVIRGIVQPVELSQERLGTAYRIEERRSGCVLRNDETNAALCHVSMQGGELEFLGTHNTLSHTDIYAKFIDQKIVESRLTLSLHFPSGDVNAGYSIDSNGMVTKYIEPISRSEKNSGDEEDIESHIQKRGEFIVKEQSSDLKRFPELRFNERDGGIFVLEIVDGGGALITLRVIEGVIQAYAEGDGWCDILPRAASHDVKIVTDYLTDSGTVGKTAMTQSLAWLYRMLCTKATGQA